MNEKMSINMCGSLVFPFDLGTSLFVFILLSLLRPFVGNSVLGSPVSREKKLILSLRKSMQL